MKTEITTSVQVTVGQLCLFPETVVLVFQMSMLSILGTVWSNQHKRCFECPLNSCQMQSSTEFYRILFYCVGQGVRKILVMKLFSLFLLFHPALSPSPSPFSLFLPPMGSGITIIFLPSLLLTWSICKLKKENTLEMQTSQQTRIFFQPFRLNMDVALQY